MSTGTANNPQTTRRQPAGDDYRSDGFVLSSQTRSFWRFLALLLTAAVIPMLLFGAWVAYFVADQTRTAARQRALTAMRIVADRVSSELATEIQVGEALAASEALQRNDYNSFYKLASRLTKKRPLWETVSLSRPDGSQILNVLRPYGDVLGPVSDPESLQKAIRTQEATIGNIEPVDANSKKLLVPLRIPVRQGGQLRYLITIDLSSTRIRSILNESGAPQGWSGTIVDGLGRVVADTSANVEDVGRDSSGSLKEALAQAANGFYDAGLLATPGLVSAAMKLPIADGWWVHFGVPADVFDGPVRRSQLLLVAGGASSLILALMLSAIIARDATRRRSDENRQVSIALHLLEERGAVALDAAELGTWRYCPEDGMFFLSHRTCRHLGISAGALDAPEVQITRAAFFATVQHDDRAGLAVAFDRCFMQGDTLDVEFRSSAPGQRWLRLSGRATGVSASGANVPQGVVADVSPQKQADAEKLRLLRRIHGTQEAEQRRIARELHDQVGQSVVALSLGLKRVTDRIPAAGDRPQDVEAKAELADLIRLASDVGRDIQRVAMDLRPSVLDDLGLFRSLEAYAETWSKRFAVAVDIQVPEASKRLPAEVEVAAYRIVQEALTNVAKHAHASSVSIVCEERQAELRLVIEDDGVGFRSPAKRSNSASTHLGITGMLERLTLLRGTMRIESTPSQKGTTLFVEIPLVGMLS